ncbi:cohesin domain-containing protein [Rugamonas rubra]|uniref:PEP-CTERM protein-sorting domain-containing protein n=1 Tax=Rugamonas rubra TaxID=758825 RepID=A0A1I4LEM2_9BURK|nr:cohesin domain-containing protein [Rugamonas rubra]SFL89263.1 PEP-CTERM protein-sorting domain-containing protein [Rugamonas rubra]
MKKICCAAMLWLLTLAWLPSARALSITLDPRGGFQVAPGGTLLLDINIDGLRSGGLNTELGAFQFDLLFDPTLFQFVAGLPSAFGSGLGVVGDPGSALGFVDLVAPGQLHLAEVSLLDGATLRAMQGDAFLLGTLAFNVTMPPPPVPPDTIIVADDILLGDAAGDRILGLANVNPQVILQVDEPGTLAALALGLAAMAGVRRRGHGAAPRRIMAPWRPGAV